MKVLHLYDYTSKDYIESYILIKKILKNLILLVEKQAFTAYRILH